MELSKLIELGDSLKEFIEHYSFGASEISKMVNDWQNNYNYCTNAKDDVNLNKYNDWYDNLLIFVLENENYDSNSRKVITVKQNKLVKKRNYEILMSILESYTSIVPDGITRLERLLNTIHQQLHIIDKEIVNEQILQDKFVHFLNSFGNTIKEETLPSCNGAGSRIDFLLKDDGIGLEIKTTKRISLNDKKLGEEINDDIIKYRKHSFIKSLYFYVYDPDYTLKRREQIIKDSEEQSTSGYKIRVIIKP